MKEAAYCGTRAIYGDMETSAKSLIANSNVDRVHFVIEDGEFPHELPDIIQCHDLSKQEFFKPSSPNMRSGYTYMAMMRIALCHVLAETDKVLSLDADTIVMKDCSEIWGIPMDGCYFAACEEWHRSANGLQYCNHGVVLYDLEMMRDGKADECIDVLNRRRFQWVEQDVGNYLCQGRIAKMPSKYNGNWWTNKDRGKPVIKHYAGKKRKEWAELPAVTKWRDMPWEKVMELHG